MSIEAEGEIKEWGNSFGIRIRKDFVEKNKLKGRIKFIILDDKKSREALSRIFGIAKDWKKPTQKIMEEIDAGNA